MKPRTCRLLKDKLFASVFVFACVAATGVVGGVWAADPGPAYVPNEYIIHVESGTDPSAVQQLVSNMGAQVVSRLPLDDTYWIRMGSAPTAVQSSTRSRKISATSWVIDSIQPNYIHRANAIPDNEFWSYQWDMVSIDMPSAWDITKGVPISSNNPVVVAVVDTGVAQHPNLVNRLLPGFDFVIDSAGGNFDQVGHGTHVAGTIAAQGDIGIGICGVCWDSVMILPVRFLDSTGSGSTANEVLALDWAMQNGAQVVNMSFGVPYSVGPDPTEQAEITKLENDNIVMVAAAGNDYGLSVGYPAAYPGVIAVGACGPEDEISYYSDYGPGDVIALVAPGGDDTIGGSNGEVFSTWVDWDANGNPEYTWAQIEGTSMACPHVVGAAALLLSHGVAPADIRSRLTLTARAPSTGGAMNAVQYGAGILDVYAALSGSSLKITKPAKGSTVTSTPSFEVDMVGIVTSSINVYVDYPDAITNGIPDNLGGPTVINSSNIGSYIDSSGTTLTFSWPLSGQTAFAGGTHQIYVSGISSFDGSTVYDWEAFTVPSQTIPAGIYLYALPFAVNNTLVQPSDLLSGTNFSPSYSQADLLWQWIAAPPAVGGTTQIGYQEFSPANTSGLAWFNTLYNPGNGSPVTVSGGYYSNVNTGSPTFAFPAGAGFWLILPQAASINSIYAADEIDSLASFDQTKGFEIPLYQGWNLIGNPYAHSVPSWAGLQFTYQGVTMSLQEASAAGWISPTIYGYTSGAGYVDISEQNNTLDPFNGYWLLALVGGAGPGESLTLTIMP